MRFQELVSHRCKAWAFMRAGCPYLPLLWHEEDEDDEPEIDVPPIPERRRVPKQGVRTGDVLAQAEAVVAAYQAVRSAGAEAPVPAWAGQLKNAAGAGGKEALLALALEGILIAGATALLGYGFKRSFPAGLHLDPRLASLFRLRSMRPVSGAVTPGSLVRSVVEPEPG